MSEGKPPPDYRCEDEERVILYRESAVNLRELAGKVRFDLTRRQQLLLMADAFDRAAARIEEPPVNAPLTDAAAGPLIGQNSRENVRPATINPDQEATDKTPITSIDDARDNRVSLGFR